MIEVRCRSAGQRVVLELAGELSSATAPVVRSCIDAAFATGAATLVLDLTDLGVLTSAGARVVERFPRALANQFR